MGYHFSCTAITHVFCVPKVLLYLQCTCNISRADDSYASPSRGHCATCPSGLIQAASAYWSAAVHDFEHGGVNNDFLIKTAHLLAILYNDQSPLENHHVAAAAKEQLKPEHQFVPVSVLVC